MMRGLTSWHIKFASALLMIASTTTSSSQDKAAEQALLARGEPAGGETVFATCRACHVLAPSEGQRIGPHLDNLINRPVASVEQYQYSDAMRRYGGQWTPERLNQYLAAPQQTVPGTKMTYPGLQSEQQRANLIAWLNQQADQPIAIDAAASTAGKDSRSDQRGSNEQADLGPLHPAPGAATTHAYCSSCHSAMIVAQQGMSRDRWDELLEWMVEEQGMAQMAQEDRKTVLDYLAQHYGEDRPNFPR